MSKIITSSSNNEIHIINNQLFDINSGWVMTDPWGNMIVPQVGDYIRFIFVSYVGPEWDGTTYTLPLTGSFNVISEQGTTIGSINVNLATGETVSFSGLNGEQFNDWGAWVTSVTETGPNQFSCELTTVQPDTTEFNIQGIAEGETISVAIGEPFSPPFFDFTPAYTQPVRMDATTGDSSIATADISPGADPTGWSLMMEGVAVGNTTVTVNLYDANDTVLDSKTYNVSVTVRYATYYNLYNYGTWVGPGETITVKNKNTTTDLTVEFDGVPYGFTVSTDDPNIATAYYDSANRILQITPVSDGTAVLTIEFTHDDGVTVETNTYYLNVYTPSYATDFEIVGYNPNDTITMREGQNKGFTIQYIGGDEPYDMNIYANDPSICSPNFWPGDIYTLTIFANYTISTTTLIATMTLGDGTTTVTHSYTVDVQQRIPATDFDLSGYSEGDTITVSSEQMVQVLTYPQDSSIYDGFDVYSSDGSVLNTYQTGDPYNTYVVLQPINSGTATLTVSLGDGQGGTVTKQYNVEVSYSPTPTGMGFLGENAVAFFKGKLNERINILYGAPDEYTYGTVGQLIEDVTNGKLYICTSDAGSYTWEEVGTGGGGGANVFTNNEWDALWA